MSEEYGPDFITVTDEDGNDIELEMLDALEYNGQTYMAFCPAVEEGADEDSEEYGLVILKSIEENGEELLSTLDSSTPYTISSWSVCVRMRTRSDPSFSYRRHSIKKVPLL